MFHIVFSTADSVFGLQTQSEVSPPTGQPIPTPNTTVSKLGLMLLDESEPGLSSTFTITILTFSVGNDELPTFGHRGEYEIMDTQNLGSAFQLVSKRAQ